MQEFQAFLASTPVFAFFILCALYAIGEFIGTYTKAWIPSVFISCRILDILTERHR